MIRRPPESTLLTHPFPTRRSADLFRRVHRSQLGARLRRAGHRSAGNQVLLHRRRDRRLKRETAGGGQRPPPQRQGGALRAPPFSLVLPWALAMGRSEEHTSELQSLMRISYDVFCLKKKNRN